MSERKVLNKYYPPDFDPVKLREKAREVRQRDRRRGKAGPKQMNVRFMMPFTMCCSNCNEFSYVGTKFNSRIEKVYGEDYLGIIIWRIYGKCPSCSCEFAFKTDPQNTAYILEFGGTRTYDPHRDASVVEESAKDKFKREMEGDVMKSLEHKTYTTANELLDLEQLDELRRLNKRMLKTNDLTEDVLLKLNKVDKQHGSFVDVPTSEDAEAKKLEEEESELKNFKKEQEYLFHKKRRKEQSSVDGVANTAASSDRCSAVPAAAAAVSPTLPHHLREGKRNGGDCDSSNSDGSDGEEQAAETAARNSAVRSNSNPAEDSSSEEEGDLRQMLLLHTAANGSAGGSQPKRTAAKIKVFKPQN